MGAPHETNGSFSSPSPSPPTLDCLQNIPLSYNHAESHASALRLILSLYPDWKGPGNKIEFVRFTDGITNTVCFEYTSYQSRADLDA